MISIREAYKESLRIRMIEEEIALRYSEQEMRCPTHLSIGQELIPVIVSSFLEPKDKVYSTHRAHAHYLAKGGNLKALIAELYGKESGCTGGRGGSMHLTDLNAGFVASTAIVANSIPLAAGNALNMKLSNKNSLVVSYFGDGATEEGAFYETINFAAVHKLPLLFVCENNYYSVYSPLSPRQPSNRHIADMVRAMGIHSFSGNGNSFQETKSVVENAISHIKTSQEPAFIELTTFRHREHCGPNYDDDLGYRSNEEIEFWKSIDPIHQLSEQLKIEDDFEEWNSSLIKSVQEEIEQAFLFAKQSSFPTPDNNTEFIYAK